MKTIPTFILMLLASVSAKPQNNLGYKLIDTLYKKVQREYECSTDIYLNKAILPSLHDNLLKNENLWWIQRGFMPMLTDGEKVIRDDNYFVLDTNELNIPLISSDIFLNLSNQNSIMISISTPLIIRECTYILFSIRQLKRLFVRYQIMIRINADKTISIQTQ